MTHDEFCAEVEKLKTYRSRDVFFDTLAELCFRRIASLDIDIMKRDAEIENLKTRLSGKTNYCEACDGMGQEIAELKKAFGQLIDLHDDCPNYGDGLGEVYDKCPADLLAKYGSGDELCRECWKRFLMGGEK